MMDSAPLPVTGYVDTVSSTCVEGWAAFPACPERQVMVQAVLDGVVVGQGATREFRPDVQQALGLGAEMVGFRLELEIAPDRCPELEVLAFDGAVWTPLLRSSAAAVAPPAQMAPSDIDPDSFQRLVTLGLVGVEGGAFPLAPMRGKTVLILDAEGDMFHNEALRQGAARVVRHVIGDDRRHFARDGDPCLPRPLRAGSDLPEGRFDIIIFGDAGDISAYGRSIFADLALRLAPGGVLVLECLALPVGENSGFGFASLPIGAQHVVHLDYLVDGLLADFSVRIMGASPVRAGDVLPRYALRCMPWQNTAILVPGMPLLGKSSIVRQFKRRGYPVFATDQFLAQLLSLSAPVEGSLPARLQALVNVPDPPEFGRFSIIFSEAGLGPELARWMVAALPRDADMFFIEGDLLRHDAIAGPLMTALAALGIRVWSLQREK